MFTKMMFRIEQFCILQDISLFENFLSQFLDEEDKKKSCDMQLMQAKAVYGLSKLLHFNIEQLKKYEIVFIPLSDQYLRHQIVQNFL